MPFKRVGIGVVFIGILFISFWIRIQGSERLHLKSGDEKVGLFTGTDAYLYHWQAKEIAERGYLPARDKHRWLPLGRDNRQLLSLYAYLIAYTHQAFPWLSLYHIQLYAPILCFTLGLGVLFLFLSRACGFIFASIVCLLLASLPGSVERSALGFGDRDALCWLFGVLTITSYLWKEQMAYGRRRWFVTGFAGFTVLLGGLSWEGFGFFVIIILSAELWKFCTTDTEHHLKEYILWLFMFVPWLYLITPVYRNAYGFSTHVAALMLLPPLTVFVLRGTRYLLLRYIEYFRAHAQKLAVVLTFLGIAAGVCYIFSQSGTFETTAFAFKESRLMKDVGELIDPHFEYWSTRYGSIFVLGSIGLILSSLSLWKSNGIPLVCALFLFIATTFFRGPVSEWISAGLCDTLFLISLILTFLWLGIACLRETAAKNELLTIITLVWFLLWVGLARGGKRYDFFIGLPIAYGAAWTLWTVPTYLIQKLTSHRLHRWITAGFTFAVLIPILFWDPFGGHAQRSVDAAAKWRRPTPRVKTTIRAFHWMKAIRSQETVVAASWEYGTQLNNLGDVKTITDSDHFIPHWVHLHYRHAYCAQDEREALTYLKTHNVTHLMLTTRDVYRKSNVYSFLGSDENEDRRFGLIPLTITEKHLLNPSDTPFKHIEVFDPTTAHPKYLRAHLKNGKTVMLPYVAIVSVYSKTSPPENTPNKYGGVVLYFDTNRLSDAYYIPPIGWNSLAIRLFYRTQHSTAFTRVFPIDPHINIGTKVWEIHYPPDIKKDSKYLATEHRPTHKK